MLPKLRAPKATQDAKQPKDLSKSVNFHEEYLRALRSKSYVDFFDKAQLLAHQPSIYSNQNKYSETLLEPGQETVHNIIDTTILSQKSELKNLMLDYFDISAEASLICSHLLNTINQVQCNYKFIERALEIMDNDDDDNSQQKLKLIIVELNSSILTNPFSNLKCHDFKLISDENASVLNRLKSMRKMLERNFKLKTYLKTSEFCDLVGCDIVAITTRTLTALVTPTILNFTCKNLEKELPRFSRRFLGKVCEQLEIAAKGTYILNKDLDTMSRLVDRLYDDIEHIRAKIQFCLDKKIHKFSLQIVKELRKSDDGFRKTVEELKEHACLCLVTINRSRDLVTKEMTKMAA
ncbi:hypothetical protein ACSQ67_025056 [Phaseolus vulgaris]